MIEMSDEEFEKIAAQAMEALPEEFTSKIENIDIIIEDYPSSDVMHGMKVSKYGLLGLYSGVPQKNRTPGIYGNLLPDRIYLYKKNIESFANSREELIDQIQRTLLHEIGHYFGIDDRRLRELGY